MKSADEPPWSGCASATGLVDVVPRVRRQELQPDHEIRAGIGGGLFGV